MFAVVGYHTCSPTTALTQGTFANSIGHEHGVYHEAAVQKRSRVTFDPDPAMA